MPSRTPSALLGAGMLLLAVACDSPSPAGRPRDTEEEPTATGSPAPRPQPSFTEYPVPTGSRPHDVAPASDGGVWYTAQGSGELGRLDPATGRTRHIPLGEGSAPHGVIVGPDDAPWITDGGTSIRLAVLP
jgi:streptogramin lyase